ncbi:hypothetical protein [uncultured Arsenicicoccus sp.]|uniref:hypothetical protein n=1 Tax=uncultured Arsenicicoccus sp. TaxID=491339 RepID=UPI00259A8E79|nr:hypothetical protein [uncultured Arsenicicoccus sp.]
MTTSHYLEAEKLLDLAREHANLSDESYNARAALFATLAQAHATLALATRPAEQPEPAPEPEAVPLWRAAETWGDDIEVQSLSFPGLRWRVRGGNFHRLGMGWDKWWALTPASNAMVTLASREPYRDDPWATPGEDVTMRLMVGDTPPAGTILVDRFGYLYRVEADGTFTSRTGKRWSRDPGRRWANDLSSYTPLHVATPDQLTAAGIEVRS